MLTKPLKITFTAGQAAALRVALEQLIAVPDATDSNALARLVVADWYSRNAGKFVLMGDLLRLTFTPPQAYAVNLLFKAHPYELDASLRIAQAIIGVIDPKV